MPDKIPLLRSGERGAFKRCQMRWWWGYREGLKERKHKADFYWFGIGIHLALQERYKFKGLRRGRNVLGVWRDYVGNEIAYVRTLPNSYSVDEEPVWVEAGELGEAMLGAYLDEYGKDERWYMLATEREFLVPIPHPNPQRRNEILVKFMSRFDGVARDEAGQHHNLWLWENKTAKDLRTGHLTLDDQGGSYWAFAADALFEQGVIKKREPLTGILYNFLRKAKPDDRPQDANGLALNQDGSVSKRQPTALFLREEVMRTRAERRMQVAHIQAEALQMKPLRTQPSLLTKTPTKDCSWDCPFYQMCELHESGEDWHELRDAMFRPIDPYSSYRISTAE